MHTSPYIYMWFFRSTHIENVRWLFPWQFDFKAILRWSNIHSHYQNVNRWNTNTKPVPHDHPYNFWMSLLWAQHFNCLRDYFKKKSRTSNRNILSKHQTLHWYYNSFCFSKHFQGVENTGPTNRHSYRQYNGVILSLFKTQQHQDSKLSYEVRRNFSTFSRKQFK